ncbi:Dicer-like protein 2 [Aspergillus niger]|nr:Dicer-like protein 2 [Aspergillus niger]
MASSTDYHADSTPGTTSNMELRIREYQLEMLNESLKRNVIVVMPTGTGKTQVAILRILADIDKGDSDKFVWLLCPTVALSEQHTHTIRNRVPSMWCRGFTSRDQVEHWKDKAIWDNALSGIKIAVSTYQVLYDALTHGFVKLSQMSLLIFDEAHHCKKDHVANKIMQVHYHKQPQSGVQNLPKILGLTASPILSDLSSLENVESNLGSICKTPRQYYAQLLQFTNRPLILPRLPSYTIPDCSVKAPILEKLCGILSSEDEVPSSSKMRSKQLKHIRRFIQSSESINQELGIWAATEYMRKSIMHFKESMRMSAEKTNISNHGKDFAMEILTRLGKLQDCSAAMQPEEISPMCQCLLDELSKAYREGFCGLVFVTQRATVLALKWLIENHPLTSRLFTCGTFIGMSTTQYSKTQLGNLHDIRNQSETLEKFRQGSLNLIITTDALEEGIDVPACNTVLNFNCQLSLKSFIQRRGRARRENSQFIIIMEDESGPRYLKRLEMEEIELVQKLQNAERRQIPANELDFDKYERISFSLDIDRTGARLIMREAVGYLYNFCSKLPAQPYVSNKPLFTYERNNYGRFRAVVKLPSNLDPSLQSFSSSRSWSRLKYAREDAALQAYKALYQAGLVNDYLVPTQVSDHLEGDIIFRSHYSIQNQLDPWQDIALSWKLDSQLYAHNLRIIRPEEDEIHLHMILPTQLDTTIHIPLFIDYCTTYTVILTPGHPITTDVSLCQQVTNLIFQSVYRDHCSRKNLDYAFLLVPGLEETKLIEFLERYSGSVSLTELLNQEATPSALGLLRSHTRPSRPLLVEPWVAGECFLSDELSISSFDAKVKYMTNRRNFLSHGNLAAGKSTNSEPRIGLEANVKSMSVRDFFVDKLPFMFAQVALFTPSIFHEVEVHMIAQILRQELSLRSVTPWKRIDLLAIAIRPTSIEHRATFRSLAFIGDAFMKYLFAMQLFLHHHLWHEGLLSSLKQKNLSDAGLAHAIQQSGLGKFLISKHLNGKRWVPPLVSGIEPASNEARQRSIGAATLADMTKAVVGAAFIDGGLNQAAACASVMFPKLKSWNASSLHDGTYSKTRPENAVASTAIVDMEELLGYTFTDKSLAVESMTHPSCTGLVQTTSYRRLSFLGASVLEWIVVSYLHRHAQVMNPKRMQSLKSAFTNNTFLTFIAITFHQVRKQNHIEVDDEHKVHRNVTTCSIRLWDFLRLHSDALSAELSDFVQKSSEKVDAIKHELWEQRFYPWVRLSALGDMRVLSDIIQSIFGAVFIDSQATLASCDALAEKLGIVPLLEHFISHQITTDHPKDTLQAILPGRKVSYQICVDKEHPGTLRCSALADSSEIASVEGQMNDEVIKMQAAETAVRLLRKGFALSETS